MAVKRLERQTTQNGWLRPPRSEFGCADQARQNLEFHPTLVVKTIEDSDDLAGLKKAGWVVSLAREAMHEAVQPGISTGDLDAIGCNVLREHSARSAPKVTYNFPGFTCVSVNNEAAHGIGRSLHEYPDVPSVVTLGNSPVLHEGMVLAIEPFLSFGATHTVQALDGWTLLTNNGSLVAQFEHTVVVAKCEPIVLTAAS